MPNPDLSTLVDHWRTVREAFQVGEDPIPAADAENVLTAIRSSRQALAYDLGLSPVDLASIASDLDECERIVNERTAP